jgi:hypothetical protein
VRECPKETSGSTFAARAAVSQASSWASCHGLESASQPIERRATRMPARAKRGSANMSGLLSAMPTVSACAGGAAVASRAAAVASSRARRVRLGGVMRMAPFG